MIYFTLHIRTLLNFYQKNKKLLDIFCGGTVDLNNGKISYPFDYDPKDLFNIQMIFTKMKNFK